MKLKTFSEIIKLNRFSKDLSVENYFLSSINDDNNSISFREFFNNVEIISQKILKDYGRRKTFLIPAYNNINFIQSLLYVIVSGNTAIPFNPYLIKFDNQKINDIAQKYQINHIINFKNNDFNITELHKDNDSNNKIDSSLAIFTSGTTGESKLVLLTEQSILNNIYSVIDSMNLNNPENIYIILPLFHSFALITQLLLSIVTGANIFLSEKNRDYGEISDLIFNKNINTIAGVPANFKMLLFGEKESFNSIKHITVAGASLDKNLANEIKKSFPNSQLWIGYGLTEAGPRVTAINYDDPKFNTGSVGKAIKNVDIFIKNKEIIVKSDSNMIGYLNDNELTNQKIVNNELYSGDTGFIDEQDYLYVTGRKDDIFISAGEKIAPYLIEKVLNSHPDISSSAVFGEDDNILGKRIVAIIKLKSEGLKTKDLLIHCSKELEKHYIPHKFFKTNDLPTTPSGKIRRKELLLWTKEKI